MTSKDQDPYGLERFVKAQDSVYEEALDEIKAGAKRSHWMWFIFPQYVGLGSSEMTKLYSIKSLDEASAYLEHPILGPRLLDCIDAALAVEGRSALAIFGRPDDQKLHSSATLFASVSPVDSTFHKLLDKFFQGKHDPETLRLTGLIPK